MNMTKKEIPLFTSGTVFLVAIILLGLVVAIIRFAQGLGATTNLSDQFPWGLWIAFDDLTGVALAAGGFSIAALVSIFNLKKYRTLLGPAILTAFLGYLMVAVGVLFDLGQPYRIWHPLIMWNSHSLMFAVSWWVILGLPLLAIQLSPFLLNKFKMRGLFNLVKGLTVPIVIAGTILAILHQSSLGALFLIMPAKLHPLWYSPLLPLLFLISAMAVGLAMVSCESIISSNVFKHGLPLNLLAGLSKAVFWILVVYFLLKVGDLIARGSLSAVFTGGMEGRMFLIELICGVVLPIVLLAIPSIRNNPGGLFLSAALVVIGVVINRLNVAIIGLASAVGGLTYFPSWMEFTLTLLILAGGLLAFKLAIKYFSIFPQEEYT